MVMNKESLIKAFKEEAKYANQLTFPSCVDSFANIWEHEFGSLDGLPSDVDDLIAHRAVELGLME
ncbi:hypothetical protein ACSVDA_08630 [Cytobacillus sp. Hm23]